MAAMAQQDVNDSLCSRLSLPKWTKDLSGHDTSPQICLGPNEAPCRSYLSTVNNRPKWAAAGWRDSSRRPRSRAPKLGRLYSSGAEAPALQRISHYQNVFNVLTHCSSAFHDND